MKEKLKEKLKKNQKGITLIALVITIIVLLILAGVSIATLTGENGVLTQANNAKIENRGGAVEEAKNLWKTNQKLDEHTENNKTETLDQLLSRLKSEKLLNDEEINTIKETGTITIGTHKIDFFEENPIELTYKIEKSSKGEYSIIIGIKSMEYELYASQILSGKTLTEKGELFLEGVSYWDMNDGYINKAYDSLEEYFKIAYEKGWYDKEYTSLEEFVNEECGSEEEFFDYMLIENRCIKPKEYEEEYPYMEGTLINPDGSESDLWTDAELDNENDIRYIITQNGEYNFKFTNYDGRTGEITVNINENEPQIVSLGSFRIPYFSVIAGYDNFIEIEKASIKVREKIYDYSMPEEEKEFDLTPYIAYDREYRCNSIDIWGEDISEFIYWRFYGEISITANGKTMKTEGFFEQN